MCVGGGYANWVDTNLCVSYWKLCALTFPHFPIFSPSFISLIFFFNWCSHYSFLAFLILFLIPHLNFFCPSAPIFPSPFFSAVPSLPSFTPLHDFPFSHSPNCFSSSRKKSVSLNYAISSSLGSSSVRGATLQHPQTPLEAYPGGPRSPLTGLAVMGVESICFTSEGCVREDRPVGGGKGRRGRGVGWEEAGDPYPQMGRTCYLIPFLVNTCCFVSPGVTWVSSTLGTRPFSLLFVHTVLCHYLII